VHTRRTGQRSSRDVTCAHLRLGAQWSPWTDAFSGAGHITPRNPGLLFPRWPSFTAPACCRLSAAGEGNYAPARSVRMTVTSGRLWRIKSPSEVGRIGLRASKSLLLKEVLVAPQLPRRSVVKG